MNNGLTNTNILSIAIDPTNSQIIYAGTDGGGVYKSTNGGANWAKMNNGLTNTNILSIAIDPENTQTLYAGTKLGVFKYILTFDISASADTGGSITLLDNVKVNYGESQTFTITPNTGYRIKDVKVDGSSVGAVAIYTFENVSSDHIIEAIFEPITFTITASAGFGGTITPSGSVTVNYGDSKTFTVTPTSGYKISNVKVDGASKGTISSYTFSNITSDHKIEATFEKEKTETVITLQPDNPYMTVNGVQQEIDPGRGTKPVIIPKWLNGQERLCLSVQ